MSQVHFLDLFLGYEPPEAIRPAVEALTLDHADLDREARTISLYLTSDCYLPEQSMEGIASELESRYGLKRLALSVQYPPEALATFDYHDLYRVFVKCYSPSAAILAGANYVLEGETLTIHLRANGKNELLSHLPRAERFLEERFGVHISIAVEAHSNLEGKALFEETARIRREAIKNAPALAEQAAKAAAKASGGKSPAASQPSGDLFYGKPFHGEKVPIRDLNLDMFRVVIEGKVFAVQHRELKKRNAYVICFDVTDYTGSVRINQFMEADKAKPILENVQAGMWVRVQGKMTFDRYDNEMVMQPNSIQKLKAPKREDTAKDKRVELHLHTTMSSMDALTETAAAVKQAAAWGHRAIAITDHGCAQSFPDAMKAASKAKVAGTDENIKILYGCEGYYVNDVDDRIVVHGDGEADFDAEYVAFDLETTGLSAQHDVIIEIGAVVMKRGEVLDTFQTFVAPGRRLTPKIIDLTGITDEMLTGAPPIEEVLPKFLEFVNGRPLCAHNADFDIGFVTAACERLGLPFQPTSVDTLILAQNLMPDLGKYKLNIVADALSLPDFNHHRASDDAITCGYMLARFYTMLEEKDIHTLQAINPAMVALRSGGKIMDRRARHILVFAKNSIGLRNLYRLISDGNLKYFKRYPIMPKSEMLRWREGLLIGSACEAGELFQAVMAHKSHAELKRIASFYDFLEIQPLCNNAFMLEKGLAESEDELRSFNRTIVELGEELGKPVVATGDVHFLNPEDEIYRHILLATKQMADADRSLPLYFKTTDEMLAEFSYLGEEKAYEIVVKNPNMIVDWCDQVRPVPHNLFAPKIENSVEDLKSLVYGKMHRLYGETPPELVQKRVDTEMNDIISCHYDVIYMSAQKLVQNSLEHGYLVGSRGSVGSSVIATLCGVSEVNPLPPHYRCPKCRHSEFFTNGEVGSGFDLPPKNCPACGTPMLMDGHDIPFETFLGFHGEKAPDIDLNFSGDNQADAHKYTEVLFGKENIFRAGTVGTIASKTAYGFVKKFLEEKGLTLTKAEENRLISGCVGIKRTTGQHPGGIVVIPKEYQIYDFTPIQHPADKDSSGVITTHFAFEYLHDTLLKLDILGHDVPTFYKVFEDYTGIDIRTVPMNDPEVMELFNSTKPLKPREDTGCELGAHALPEITPYVMQMMQTAKPKTFADLLQISGLSHGTGIWLGNGEELIKNGTCTIKEIIGTRDSIMLYLIQKGVDYSMAFKIMESVRKGKGLTEEMETAMRGSAVPEWYIESCKKIRYMFPKSHAAAYMMGTLRLGWCKVHRPVEYYATYFTVKPEGFDASIAAGGMKAVRKKIVELENSEETNKKDADTLVCLQVIREMFARGYEFLPVDVYKSHAYRFVPENGKIRMPFSALVGLGETAAQNIYDAIRNGRATTLEELKTVASLTKNVVEILRSNDCLGGLPESDQMTLF